MVSETQIADVRRFNRTVTQRVGALSDRFLGRNRPLAESRVLWEAGADGCEVRTLRNRLELDSGQLSRILRSLEASGLVVVEPSPLDGRVRIVRPTPAGLRERAVLDRRSDELAESILAALDPDKRNRLLDAMRSVERLLTSAAVELREMDAAHPDARQCLRSYYAELNNRSDMPYDPAAGISAEPHEMAPPNGCFVVVYLHGEPVGCGGVKLHPGEPCEIKRMWLSPAVRGLGLGRRLLAELEQRASNSGAEIAHIETNGVLEEAINLYRSVGYVDVPAFNDEPFATHWFEKRLK